MFWPSEFRCDTHRDIVLLRRNQVITGHLAAILGPSFRVLVTPFEFQRTDTGLFVDFPNGSLQGRFLAFTNTLWKIPVSIGPEHQGYIAGTGLAHNNGTAGQFVLLLGHAVLSTSTGGALMAPRAATKPLTHTSAIPPASPATHSMPLNV